MTWTRSNDRPLALLLGLLFASACGDDGTTDSSTTVAATTGDTTGPASTGPSTDGTTSSQPTTDSGSTATETSAGSSTAADGTTTSTCEETVGPDDGTEVAACEECSPEQLCMRLTEIAGPADGGGPMVSYFCFPFPACCDAGAADCDCAGHLCPEEVLGGEGSCQRGEGILECEVAYP